MRLTSKGRYAVTAMLDLALHGGNQPVALNDVAVRQAIPVSYLGQIFVQLRQHGLVVSRRGPGGGYALAKAPENVSVADVIRAVKESVDSTRCGGKADCQSRKRCLTHGLWEGLNRSIHGFLSETSLAKVLAERNVAEVAERQDRLFRKHCEVAVNYRDEFASEQVQ